MDNIHKYYSERAREYDRVYQKPERQDDLRKLEKMVELEFAGLEVLEIACGTGYWTQFIARAAAKIFAIDSSHETLKIATGRDYESCPVEFTQSDAYTLNNVKPGYSGGF